MIKSLSKLKLIVKKLPKKATLEQIKTHFPGVVEIKMHMINNKFSGTAFLHFRELDSLNNVLESDNFRTFNGKKITVEYCEPKDKYLREKGVFLETSDKNKFNNKHGGLNKREDRELDSSKDNLNHKSEGKLGKKEAYLKKKETSQPNQGFKLITNEKSNKKSELKRMNKKIDRKCSKNVAIGPENSAEKDFKEICKREVSETKIEISNLSYKETESSIRKYFSKFGTIKEVNLEFKDCVFTGKAIITYTSFRRFDILDHEHIINDNYLLISCINKKIRYNHRRVILKNIKKSLEKVHLRKMLARYKIKSIQLKHTGKKKRNLGFGFVEFMDEQECALFVENYDKLKENIGPDSMVEFSIEKY